VLYSYIRNNKYINMAHSLEIFKALSDLARIRIVRAVSQAELSVAELVGVLGLPQSTVSRHLKPLRDAGLVEARREGTSVYYRRGRSLADHALAAFVDGQFDVMDRATEDRASVRRVLDARKRTSREFFDRIAGSYGSLTEPGGGWPALAAGMAAGFSGCEVADLGAGEGVLTLLLARFAAQVTAVDMSPEMLRHVQEQASLRNLRDRVRVAEGDLEALPLPDDSMDAVFLSQSLHHASRPAVAVKEAVRILRPGGLLIILDLARHEQEWVREQWADQWLGFEVNELTEWMKAAGAFSDYVERYEGATPELTVLIAVGRKIPVDKSKATQENTRRKR